MEDKHASHKLFLLNIRTNPTQFNNYKWTKKTKLQNNVEFKKEGEW